MLHLAFISFTAAFELNPAYIVAVVAINYLLFQVARDVGAATGWSSVWRGVEVFPCPEGIFKRGVVMLHATIIGFIFYASGYDGNGKTLQYAVDLGINALLAMGFYDVFLKFVVSWAKGLLKRKHERET